MDLSLKEQLIFSFHLSSILFLPLWSLFSISLFLPEMDPLLPGVSHHPLKTSPTPLLSLSPVGSLCVHLLINVWHLPARFSWSYGSAACRLCRQPSQERPTQFFSYKPFREYFFAFGWFWLLNVDLMRGARNIQTLTWEGRRPLASPMPASTFFFCFCALKSFFEAGMFPRYFTGTRGCSSEKGNTVNSCTLFRDSKAISFVSKSHSLVLHYTAMSMAILGWGSYPFTSKSSNLKSSMFSTFLLIEMVGNGLASLSSCCLSASTWFE